MKKVFLMMAAAIVFIACDKKSSSSPQTIGNGKLTGTVYAFDDKHNPVSDLSNFAVTIDDANVRTITDATGKYSFDDLPYGIHDISFSKKGYGTFK